MHPPPPDLAGIVAHHWRVRWDLPSGDTHLIQVLPSPSIQLVVEDGAARVHGVGTAIFTRELRGCGLIAGVGFLPAGFHPLLGSPVSTLTDRVVPAAEVFDVPPQSTSDLAEFVRARLPEFDDRNVPLLNGIVGQILSDRTILKVDDIVRETGVGKRTLQRLFKEYVGVSPKWVIRRYRLQEAAERLNDRAGTDLAALAADLGYADQAHFVRDFRAVVGQPPAAYARTTRP